MAGIGVVARVHLHHDEMGVSPKIVEPVLAIESATARSQRREAAERARLGCSQGRSPAGWIGGRRTLWDVAIGLRRRTSYTSFTRWLPAGESGRSAWPTSKGCGCGWGFKRPFGDESHVAFGTNFGVPAEVAAGTPPLFPSG